MKIVRMGRQEGKSTELIKLASENWYYILCLDRRRATYLFEQARRMGLDMPFPITVNELPLNSPYIRGLLIDDVDHVLQKLVGIPKIVQCTTSCEVEVKNTGVEPKCEVDINNLFE